MKVGKIYFPMTCNILTPGHIKCLEILSRKGDVVIGLLSADALEGYKEEVVPYADRYYILKTVARAFPNVSVVKQSALNPDKNLRGCTHLASGDGFEIEEELAARRYGVRLLNIKIKGEKEKSYSSSKILSASNRPKK